MDSVRVEGSGFLVVEILAGVGGLVFDGFDEFVEAGCDQRAEDGADPVDPVVAVEGVQRDAGAEGACRVDAAAREVDLLGDVC